MSNIVNMPRTPLRPTAMRILSIAAAMILKVLHAGQMRHAEVSQPCDCLTVDFMTPTEIKTEGGTKTDLKLDFGLFIDRVFSRISAIFNNYGDG